MKELFSVLNSIVPITEVLKVQLTEIVREKGLPEGKFIKTALGISYYFVFLRTDKKSILIRVTSYSLRWDFFYASAFYNVLLSRINAGFDKRS